VIPPRLSWPSRLPTHLPLRVVLITSLWGPDQTRPDQTRTASASSSCRLTPNTVFTEPSPAQFSPAPHTWLLRAEPRNEDGAGKAGPSFAFSTDAPRKRGRCDDSSAHSRTLLRCIPGLPVQSRRLPGFCPSELPLLQPLPHPQKMPPPAPIPPGHTHRHTVSSSCCVVVRS
jgi:hypothetical protein